MQYHAKKNSSLMMMAIVDQTLNRKALAETSNL